MAEISQTMLIAFATVKGGVGKSTLSYLLALWLTLVVKARVFLIDADPQESATLDNTRAKTKLLLKRETDPSKLIDLMFELKDSCKYDYVIIDGPGSAVGSTRAILGAADLGILPMGASPKDIDSFTKCTAPAIITARRMRADGKPHLIVLPNRTRRAATKQLRGMRQFCEEQGLDVTETDLPILEHLSKYSTSGLPPWELLGGEQAREELERAFTEILEYGRDKLKLASGPESQRRTEDLGNNGRRPTADEPIGTK